MGQPRPLFHLFSVFFKQTSIQFYNKSMQKCPSSIRHWDSNPWPSERSAQPWSLFASFWEAIFLSYKISRNCTTLQVTGLIVAVFSISYFWAGFLKGHSRPLFLYFSSFQYTFINTQMFNIKVFRWLESDRGPLVSEATALPAEPQPLPCWAVLGADW